ncbi:hypothetical protein DOTSEDRAFT_28347 [Dothistroma septosporum NZE10]|uniref:Uncharacterized protein n=1 Tax=Dothistroma septosporum (strain NZE10 / CBS 128990) TaxID=675120 RepID=M2YJQ6_DOTSN|nr:hypothetical protein DOTSEDRAFT_28347 [Dothistroma septosporum NZE10]
MPTLFESLPVMDEDMDEQRDEHNAPSAESAPAIMRLGSFLLIDTNVRRMIWATISLGTSRYLLTGHVNYPLHLLAVHLAAIQTARIFPATYLRAFTHMPARQFVPDILTVILTALTMLVLISG